MIHHASPLVLFLLQSLLIIALPYYLWRFRAVRGAVPLVVVQILVGLALGPSVLGQLAPDLALALFPRPSLNSLNGLAWLAVLFFAFQTGLHFDLAELHGRGRAFAAASLGSIAVPTLAGALAGWWMAVHLDGIAGPRATTLTFALGMGIAGGVTALPVLGAILRELHLTRASIGAIALACAAVNDAALWLLVAVLLAVAGGGGAVPVLLTLIMAATFLAVTILVLKPLLPRFFAHALRQGRINEYDVVAIATLLFLMALVAEAIGIHAIIGAFVFGAVMPKPVAKEVLATVESFVTVILLPFFFIATGLKTDFDLGAEGIPLVFAVMTVLSVAGKMVGTALPLRLFGASWPFALGVGALMQCKGLMEIVVLTMLLDAGIISQACFSAMIVMALVTTAVTKLLVQSLAPCQAAAEEQ